MANHDILPMSASVEARIGTLLQELDAYLGQVMMLYSSPNDQSSPPDGTENAWEIIQGHSVRISSLMKEIDEVI